MVDLGDVDDSPFGRQPEPVTVTVEGNELDMLEWTRFFMLRAQYAGDTVTQFGPGVFRIYPRAVND